MSSKQEVDLINKINNLSSDFEIEIEFSEDENNNEIKEINNESNIITHAHSEEFDLNEEVDLKFEEIEFESKETQPSDNDKPIHLNYKLDAINVEDIKVNYDDLNIKHIMNPLINERTVEILSTSEDEGTCAEENTIGNNYQCNFCFLIYNNSEEKAEHFKAIHGNYNFNYTQNINLKAFEECFKKRENQEQKEWKEDGEYQNEKSRERQNEKLGESDDSKTMLKGNQQIIYTECTDCSKLFLGISNNTKEETSKQCETKKVVNKVYVRCLCAKEGKRNDQGHLKCEHCNISVKCKHHSKNQKVKKNNSTFKRENTTCPQCHKALLKSSLLSHIRNFHESVVCNFCNAHFFGRTSLKLHEKVHNVNTCNKQLCYICFELFTSLRQLDLHIKKSHNTPDHSQDEILRQCMYCGDFVTKISYRVHVKKCIKKKINSSKKIQLTSSSDDDEDYKINVKK